MTYSFDTELKLLTKIKTSMPTRNSITTDDYDIQFKPLEM